jgi:hypothetical protein
MSRVLAHAVAAAGAVVTGVALVVALPVFGPRPAPLLVLLLGGALLAAGSAASGTPRPVAQKTFLRSWKWGVAVVVAVAAIVASRFVDRRIDVTKAAVNTLSEESLAVARTLPVPVRVVAFVEGAGRAADELRALVGRYNDVTDRVRLELRSPERAGDLDVARATGLAELLALGGPNVAVVPVVADGASGATGAAGSIVRLRFDAGLPDAEEQLTNALRRATTTTAATRVYVVAGHGEPDVRDDGPAGLSRLRDALRARNVELVGLPLSVAGGRVPDDARALVVAPSTTPWAPAEDEAVRAFVDGGGALLALLEPETTSSSLVSLVARDGVDVLPDVVVDDSPFHAMLGGADVVTGSTQMGHEITRPLRGALTHFPRAVALSISPIDGVTTTPVVSTGAEARAPKVNAAGPLPLIVVAEPTSTSSSSSSSSASSSSSSGRGRHRGRVVVAADATFAQNGSIGLGANRDLAQNLLLWLVEDDDHIVVRPHQRGGSLVFLTPTAREALAFGLLVVVPGLLAAFGAAISAARRAR